MEDETNKYDITVKQLLYQIDEQQLIDKVQQLYWKDIDDNITQFPTGIMFNIMPPQQYKQYYIRFRQLLRLQQKSQRAKHLSKLILLIRTSNYYALMLRKDNIVIDNATSLEDQIHFINCLLNVNGKQYHLWNYKKQMIKSFMSTINNQNEPSFYSSELKFIRYLLGEDSKNYHAWDYRFWLSSTSKSIKDKQFNESQIIFTSNQQWNTCYSYWSYRFNLFKSLIIQDPIQYSYNKQFDRCMHIFESNTENQCYWNYVCGLCYQINQQSRQKLNNKIVKLIDSAKDKKIIRFALNAQLMINEIDGLDKKQLISKLKQCDPVRQLYYNYLLKSLKI